MKYAGSHSRGLYTIIKNHKAEELKENVQANKTETFSCLQACLFLGL